MEDRPYAELITLLKRAHTLGTVGDLLGWDEQVNLPPGAAEQRASQHAVVAEVQHEAASEPRIGELLEVLEGGANRGGEPPLAADGATQLDDDAHAIVRNARRDH